MQLIGLSGAKGTGKDTAGAYLVERYGFKRLAFADPLKQSVAALLDVPVTFLEATKNDPETGIALVLGPKFAGEAPLGAKFLSIREVLQRYGTEAHREVFGRDFWVEQAAKLLTDPDGRYVFTDSRFNQECAWIQERGGYVIHLERETGYGADSHASELPPDAHLIDFHVKNDGTKKQLYTRIDRMMLDGFGFSVSAQA